MRTPGKRETFRTRDIVTFPSVLLQCRQFCEQPVWPDIGVESVLVLGAAAGVAALIVAALQPFPGSHRSASRRPFIKKCR